MSSPTILVIDDEPVIRDLIIHILGNEYEVLEAESADAGIKVIRKVKIDLIIIDYKIPGKLTGLTLARLLHLEGNPTPVIMISGADAQQAALSWGVKVFIPKLLLNVPACIHAGGVVVVEGLGKGRFRHEICP